MKRLQTARKQRLKSLCVSGNYKIMLLEQLKQPENAQQQQQQQQRQRAKGNVLNCARCNPKAKLMPAKLTTATAAAKKKKKTRRNMQNFCQEAGAIKMQTTYEPDPGCYPCCPVVPLPPHRCRPVRAILENNFKPAARPPTTQTSSTLSPAT